MVPKCPGGNHKARPQTAAQWHRSPRARNRGSELGPAAASRGPAAPQVHRAGQELEQEQVSLGNCCCKLSWFLARNSHFPLRWGGSSHLPHRAGLGQMGFGAGSGAGAGGQGALPGGASPGPPTLVAEEQGWDVERTCTGLRGQDRPEGGHRARGWRQRRRRGPDLYLALAPTGRGAGPLRPQTVPGGEDEASSSPGAPIREGSPGWTCSRQVLPRAEELDVV